MTLPNANITPIPDTDPDAVPSLWNTRYGEIDENFEDLDSRITDQAGNALNADDAIKFDWLLQDRQLKMEQWSSGWQLYDPVSLTVTSAVAGDDSVDVSDTSGLVVGRAYVIFDGTNNEIVEVSEILTSTRFTATGALSNSYASGSTLAGTNWSKTVNHYATAENGELCTFLPLNVGDDSNNKYVVIRREDNDAVINVAFKDADHTSWTALSIDETRATDDDTKVDVWYILPCSGDTMLKFEVDASGAASSVDIHIIGVMNQSDFQETQPNIIRWL